MHQQQLIQLGVNAVDDPQMDLGMVLMESRQLIDEMAGQQTGNAANPQNAFPGACYLILLKMGFSMEQIKEVVLTMAIPVGSIAIIIAMQYKTGEQEMASTMALSIIASIITMGGFIFLTF